MVADVTGKKMVVGFMFGAGGATVLLVRKENPAWQRGLWNGVGGVIEQSETPSQAMAREFCEETECPTEEEDWTHFATEIEPFGAYVYFFSANKPASAPRVWPSHNDAAEMLMWHSVAGLPERRELIGNLRWLIPLALDPRGLRAPVLIEASGDIREMASW